MSIFYAMPFRRVSNVCCVKYVHFVTNLFKKLLITLTASFDMFDYFSEIL